MGYIINLAQINNSNFGAVLTVNKSGATNGSGIGGGTTITTANVDYISVTVTYALPGDINWYTASSGGTLLGPGSSFNPVGVSGSGLPNTNTPGTTTFYAECSSTPGCRAAADFVINGSVTINPFSPATGNRCQGAETLTTTTTAINSTGITYSLDATSLGGGNTINSSTGEVTYVAGWSGVSTITASAAGCSGPVTTTFTETTNPSPTLTGASQLAAVCAGSGATINLTGLLSGSTSTINYTINSVAQTPVTGVVANAGGAASFTSAALTAANNGQTLRITSVTTTSTTPNCTASFTRDVTLSVNATPTLSGASQAAAVCAGSGATINLTGLLAGSTSTINYTINGVAQTPVTGVVANGSGAASFTSAALTAANNGQTLQITGVTTTSTTPNCTASFAQDVILSVNATPTLSGASQAAAVCAGSGATINLTGLLAGSTSTINYTSMVQRKHLLQEWLLMEAAQPVSLLRHLLQPMMVRLWR